MGKYRAVFYVYALCIATLSTIFSDVLIMKSGKLWPQQIPYVDMAAMQDVTSSEGDDIELPDIMDEIVRLLLPPKRAEEYIRQHPSRNFSFFVYDDLPSEFTWQENAKCLETKLNIPHWLNASSDQISSEQLQ
jgi:hypothetical protein